MQRVLLLSALLGHVTLSMAQNAPSFITFPGAGVSGLYTEGILGRPEGGFLIVANHAAGSGGGITFVQADAMGASLDARRTLLNIAAITLCSDSGYFMRASQVMGTLLVRTDRFLNVLWARTLDAPQLPGYYFGDIAERDGTHYLVTSMQEGMIDPGLALYGTWAAVVHAFDASGTLVDQCILADTIHDPFRYGLLNPKLAPAPDGSLYIATSMLPQALAGTCNRQPTVIKLNADLDLQWCMRYPVTTYNETHDLRILPNGQVALIGHFSSNLVGCNDPWMFCHLLDTAGAVVGSRQYHHPFQESTGFGSPVVLADGTLLFAHNHIDTVFGQQATFFDHVDQTGAVLGSTAYHHPGDYAVMRLATDGDGAIAACRWQGVDTLLFTPLTSDPALYCHGVPHGTTDSSLTITPQPYLLATHLVFPFTFSDTLIDTFVTVPVNSAADCAISTGADGHGAMELTVFPNPGRGPVTVTSSALIAEIFVYDALGRVLHRSAPGTRKMMIDLPANGFHLLRATDVDGRITVRRLVRE